MTYAGGSLRGLLKCGCHSDRQGEQTPCVTSSPRPLPSASYYGVAQLGSQAMHTNSLV